MGEIDDTFGAYWRQAAYNRLQNIDGTKLPQYDAATRRREIITAASRDFDNLAAVAQNLGAALLDQGIPPDITVHRTWPGPLGGRRLGKRKAVGWLLEGRHYGGDSGHYEVDGLARSGTWVQGKPATGSVRLLDMRFDIVSCSGDDPVYAGSLIQGVRTIDGVTSTVGYKNLTVTRIDKSEYLARSADRGAYDPLSMLRNMAALAVDYNINPAELGMGPPPAEQP